MAIEKKEVSYAKEIDDVLNLVVGLVNDLKAKKDIALIVSGNLPALLTALDGINQLDAEISSNRLVALQTIGAKLGDLADAILPKPSVQ
jgi:uncharacterized protein YejL (UPF0352 family)